MPSGPPAIPGMVGQSVAMQQVYKLIGRVAASDVNVLITGESGTGKELVAGAIHQFSNRAESRLVKVNCAAIPENLLEAELFGHEKGAFTGANARRIGRFEQAHLGTLFLDEIGELQTGMQAKLLRALQDKKIERLGSSASIAVDFRLVAATARDLGDAVAAADFREDLYYRLNVVEIHLPPLRARKEDIPLLVQRFLARSERPITIRDDALEMILAHHWPGNVRELENVISRAIVLSPGGVILPESIRFPERGPMEDSAPSRAIDPRRGYWNVIREVEAQLVRSALRDSEGNKAEAARILGIQRRLLYEKMTEFGIA